MLDQRSWQFCGGDGGLRVGEADELCEALARSILTQQLAQQQQQQQQLAQQQLRSSRASRGRPSSQRGAPEHPDEAAFALAEEARLASLLEAETTAVIDDRAVARMVERIRRGERGEAVLREAMRVSVYDMAGQRVFYDIHHVCLTNHRSLYLVVFDARAPLEAKSVDIFDTAEASKIEELWRLAAGEEAGSPPEVRLESIDERMIRLAGEKGGEEGLSREAAAAWDGLATRMETSLYTNLDRLHYWLTSVHTHAPEALVVIVGTHRDAVSPAVGEAKLADIKASLQDKPYEDQIYEMCLVENNPADAEIQIAQGGAGECGGSYPADDGLDGLREMVEAVSHKLPGIQQSFPVVWLHILAVIRGKVDAGRCWMSRGEFRELVMEEGGLIEGSESPQDQIDRMLAFFHDTGEILYFYKSPAGSILREHVFLSPNWLLNVAACLISRQHIKTCLDAERHNPKGKKAWRTLLEAGVVLPVLFEGTIIMLLSNYIVAPSRTRLQIINLHSDYIVTCFWSPSKGRASSGTPPASLWGRWFKTQPKRQLCSDVSLSSIS